MKNWRVVHIYLLSFSSISYLLLWILEMFLHRPSQKMKHWSTCGMLMLPPSLMHFQSFKTGKVKQGSAKSQSGELMGVGKVPSPSKDTLVAEMQCSQDGEGWIQKQHVCIAWTRQSAGPPGLQRFQVQWNSSIENYWYCVNQLKACGISMNTAANLLKEQLLSCCWSTWWGRNAPAGGQSTGKDTGRVEQRQE